MSDIDRSFLGIGWSFPPTFRREWYGVEMLVEEDDVRSSIGIILKTITGEVNKSCVFPLNPPPPAPDFVLVQVAGTTVKRDMTKADGWEYTQTDHSVLEIFGEQCEKIKNDSADKVIIKYGCLGVVPK